MRLTADVEAMSDDNSWVHSSKVRLPWMKAEIAFLIRTSFSVTTCSGFVSRTYIIAISTSGDAA
jgi:hypothetical protein